MGWCMWIKACQEYCILKFQSTISPQAVSSKGVVVWTLMDLSRGFTEQSWFFTKQLYFHLLIITAYLLALASLWKMHYLSKTENSVWSVRKDTVGKLPFKSSFVLGASCMWRNETQWDFLMCKKLFSEIAVSKRPLNCGSVSWVLNYRCDCYKSFPFWTMDIRYTVILLKAGCTRFDLKKKPDISFKIDDLGMETINFWSLHKKSPVSFLQDFFSLTSRSSQMSPLFSCAFDILFLTLLWIDSYKTFYVKLFFHSNFLYGSWKCSCAEMKLWEAARTDCGAGNKIISFLWSSCPVMLDKVFCACMCIYTFFATVAVKQVLVVIWGISCVFFFSPEALLISSSWDTTCCFSYSSLSFAVGWARAGRTVTQLKASSAEVGW